MNFDFSAVVGTFANAVISVARPDPDTFAAGGFADPQTFTSTSDIRASIQPGPGKNLIKMPEGVRPTDVIRLWSTFEFQPRDRIVIDSGVFSFALGGRNFEVFEIGEWGDHGNFTTAYARALAADEPRP